MTTRPASVARVSNPVRWAAGLLLAVSLAICLHAFWSFHVARDAADRARHMAHSARSELARLRSEARPLQQIQTWLDAWPAASDASPLNTPGPVHRLREQAHRLGLETPDFELHPARVLPSSRRDDASFLAQRMVIRLAPATTVELLELLEQLGQGPTVRALNQHCKLEAPPAHAKLAAECSLEWLRRVRTAHDGRGT